MKIEKVNPSKKINKKPRQRGFKTQSKFEKMLNDELRKRGQINVKRRSRTIH